MNRYLSKKTSLCALLAMAGAGFCLGLAMPAVARDAAPTQVTHATTASDNGVTARVKESLAGVQSLKGDSIGVKTVDGVVTLSGTVKDPHAKFAAVQAAVSVEGVRVLDDELKTPAERSRVAMADPKSAKAPVRHSASDEKITVNVRQLLAENLPSRYKVDVVTSNGVVYLSGDVQSQEAISRVSALVAQVDGVKSVNTVGLDAPFVTMVY
ncbi:MAG TPA: BON domain-containing protein [Gammaproteobacteria bacterium]|nr:BON domain-containing protein [Gammaproteobacteria bacterium]